MDLIQRAAERLKREGAAASVVQKAAARLGTATAAAPAAYAEHPAADAADAAVPANAPARDPDAGGPGIERRRIDIDLGRLRVGGFVTPGGVRSRLSEEYRIIKRPLLNHALAPPETR